MENEKTYVTDKIADTLLEKKLDYYGGGDKADNFIVPHELTVTITLREYRELITKNAVSQASLDKCNRMRYELEKEIESLKKENDMLTRKIIRMEQPATQVDDKAEEA